MYRLTHTHAQTTYTHRHTCTNHIHTHINVHTRHTCTHHTDKCAHTTHTHTHTSINKYTDSTIEERTVTQSPWPFHLAQRAHFPALRHLLTRGEVDGKQENLCV